MRSLATWCFRHRKLVLLLWVLALLGATFLSKATGTDYSNSFTLPNTQSTQALAVLQSVSPKISGDIERIVFQTSGGVTVHDPAVMTSVTTMLGRIEALPHVTEVVSPYSPEGSAQISKDGTIAYATVTFDVLGQNVSTKEAQEFVRVAQSADGPHLSVAVAGQVAEKAIPPSIGGHAAGHPARGDRPAVGLRVAVRDGVAAPVRARLARDGHRHHRRAEQRAEDARVLSAARPAHRTRRRDRLRAVHRHAPPPGADRGPRHRDRGRQRGQHVGPRRAVRRDHRLHRAARDVRAGCLVPLRPRGLGVHRGGVHDARRAHAPARHARLHRPEGAEPPPAAPARQGWPEGRRAPGRRGSGRGGPTSSPDALWSPRSAALVIVVLVALPFFSHAARVLGCRERPRRARRRGSPTTCSRRVSARATTGRCRSSR